MEENLNENVLLCRSKECRPRYYTLKSKAKFCQDCGYELIESCPKCNIKFTVEFAGNYCPFCGKQIKYTSEPLTFMIIKDQLSNEPGFKHLDENSINLFSETK